ncbi:3'(2'),5'-bisphosphate nucleotidase CysQ [Roseomonas sp. CECT 9278]|uniref:3'(2'),5'-bisphosphate nucleotidase CysQ n=1 Tax=Roseomonas sp. CECT 9278 TaxID=2845823 RepID=UPI001E568B4D|nr:3'(2'),5'-bisphosphate nucleotidase CysQ [Roseomonas sp. CECT 9278]CAH0168668.1 3'(2'),5'-bisphosphate nucleotidase CysQ [Roseomonas sp. CECT 9278]
MITDTPTRSRLAAAFAAIAQDAGARIMAFYGAAGVQAKADGSPLTQADLAAHDAILAGLAAACPDLPVVSEEDAARAGTAPDGPFILVDPLDGTREFISGNGEFTVNIALIDAGAPVAGVVLAPALGRMWVGVQGAGAAASGPDGAPQRPILVRAPAPPGLVAVASRSHRDAETESFLAGLPIAGLRSVGSSLKFCLVAEGEADVYPRFGPTMEWDTAAGQAVLEAAGGRVVCPDGTPFRYGKAGAAWRNGGFVAWGRQG